MRKFLLFLSILGLIGVTALLTIFSLQKEDSVVQEIVEQITEEVVSDPALQKAIEAGESLSHNKCEGTGAVTLTHMPMNEEDFAFIIPYGLMIGGHVTPIDHQYFSPTVFNSPRDTYEVYAMADGKVVDIEHRTQSVSEQSDSTDEYRLVFMHTCTFFTYYDLVTSLSDELQQAFDANAKGSNSASVNIEVKAGELIGRIGGQTLDFAVWDTQKPLDGYINPNSYKAEPWKIYTANPYDYYAPDIKQTLIDKNLRVDEPIEGKIDYDIEGKLVGNWFVEGTNGYQGTEMPYWNTHLSISYDHLDPNGIIVSIGDYDGEAKQFAVERNAPDPATVDESSGVISYKLVGIEYLEPDGSPWDRMSLVQNLTMVPSGQQSGSILFQVLPDNKLKVEILPDVMTPPASFSNNAVIYER